MQGRMILVVDDSETNRVLLAEILAMEGAIVRLAEDGEQGLTAFEEHRPNMVVSDIEMPNMHGLALARAIRRQCRRTPIAFMSSGVACPRLSEEVKRFVTEGHAMGLLKKPFQTADLFMMIRSAMTPI